MISVRRGTGGNVDRNRLSAGADIEVDGNHIIVGNPPRHGNSEIRLSRGHSASTGEGHQRIQTLEGHPAFIHTGRSIPYPTNTTVIQGNRIITQRSTTFRDARQGFYVVPRVIGGRVTLGINQQHDQPSRQRGAIDLQRASTTVNGRLGEWIDLGGIDNRSHQSGNALSGSGRRISTSNLNLQVKVTELR